MRESGDDVGLLTRVSYGLGDLAFSLPWNLSAAFLLYFYTDVALLPPGPIGTVFLLSRLFDAGFDLGVGLVVDRTRSRWGKARPYFLFGAIPFALLLVAVFWVPPGGTSLRLAWAAGSFMVFGLVYSLVNIPYNALLPMLTASRAARLSLGSWRAGSTGLSVIIATACTMALVNWLGGGSKSAGFTATAAVFAALSVILTFNLFLHCRERIVVPQPAGEPVLPAIGAMLRNRAWIVVFLFALLNFVRFGAVLSVTAYFAINVLRQPQLISVLLPSVSGTLLAGSLIATPYLRRLGIRRGNSLALVAAFLLYALLPFLERAPLLFAIVYIAASLCLSLTMAATFTMGAESVDYHESLYGVRHEGMLSAGITLSTKLGIALGGALTAYGLALSGYDAHAVSATAIGAMRALYYGPALATIALQLLCMQFYPSRIGAPQPALA